MKDISFKQINSEELLKKMEEPDVIIIDIRSPDAYNGWIERNEVRGGHINGAKSLPFKWSKYIDWIEIVRSKKISPEHTLVIYGYDKNNIEIVAKVFIKSGYPYVFVYYSFIDEWSADEKYPIEKMERYTQLVSPKWLKNLLDGHTTPNYNNKRFVVCHAHYQNRKDYEEGHIPGAIDVDTNLLESPETWNRRSPEELKNVLENLGITHDTTVILYGRFSYPDNNDPFPGSSAGHLGAMRCAFIMMYAGVEDVRLLNGGIQSWIDEGYKISTKEFIKEPVQDFGVVVPSNPHFAVDLQEAKDILKDKNKNLVCVRSRDEYIGKVSGYNYIEKKGRIPGAVFADCGSDAYHMENYRNLDHTTREYHEIEDQWAKEGITREKFNAFYCGTGWRGSEAFFNAWLLGWSEIAVYDGGWFEWSNNNLPYETGLPEGGFNE
jgi:3-mercaptopyruvate sulfurtransferase SseA